MNTKLLLGGGVIAALLLFGKPKASSKSKSEKIPVDDVPEKQEDSPKEEQVPENKPSYPTLNTSRIQVINELLKIKPMFTMEPSPYGNYAKWAAQAPPGLYQDWLTNQAYWKISRNEKKTDIYTDLGKPNPDGYSGELPYLLKRGLKGFISDPDNNTGFKILEWPEFEEEANARLKKGIALWRDINKFINKNLGACPPGAKCKK